MLGQKFGYWRKKIVYSKWTNSVSGFSPRIKWLHWFTISRKFREYNWFFEYEVNNKNDKLHKAIIQFLVNLQFLISTMTTLIIVLQSIIFYPSIIYLLITFINFDQAMSIKIFDCLKIERKMFEKTLSVKITDHCRKSLWLFIVHFCGWLRRTLRLTS